MNPLNTNQRPNMMQMLQQAKADPAKFFQSLGIPQNITTPQGAVQWLLSNGRVSQSEVIKAQQIAPQIKIK